MRQRVTPVRGDVRVAALRTPWTRLLRCRRADLLPMPHPSSRRRQSRFAAAAWAAIGVLLLAGPSAAHEASTAGGGGGTARLVRMLDSSRAGITIPAGIAFSQQANAFFVVEGVPQGGAAPGETAVAQVTPFGSRVASTAVSYAIRAPINVAFDERRQRLLMLDGASTLLEIPLQGARLDVSRISRADVTSGHLQNPQGITVDPKTGTLFVLDAAGQRLVRFDPTSDGTLPGATSSVDLGTSSVQLRGIAFDAGSGDLYTVGVAERQLYELTGGGSVVAVRDLAPFGRREPQGLLVAPTTDQTDAADGTSVFLANSGVPINSAAGSRRAAAVQQPGGIAELSLTAATTTGTASFTSSLVRTTDTAAWSPPSPDPSGIAYLPTTKTLLITDGEVEETVSGITHFAGANIWETSLGGTVARTTNISKIAPTAARITNEPTGVAWNPTNGHFYVSDDDDQRVYDVNPGGDGNLGTADDTWSDFSTIGTDNVDPEGITYDTWHDRVFVSDGVNREIYQYTTNGTPIGHFDVEAYGVDDPESVEFNPDSGTLFVLSNHASEVIVEVSTGGSYLRTIDVTAARGLAPAGLAYAPASDGSSAKHFYVVDRRVDNNDDPTEVDGKLYELTAPAPTAPGNIPPTVDAGADQAVTLPNAATLDGTVADDGLPNPPGTTSVTWADVAGPSTVTFANPTAVDTTASFPIAGTYVLRLTATDGEYQTFDELTVTVTGTGSIASLDVPVKASTDDAEESDANSMQMTSADLDMMLDVGSTGTKTNLADGMRFNGIAIPRNATITNAYVQFVASEVQSSPTQLTIQAQATDNALTFGSKKSDLSLRPRTTAATLWSVDPWMAVGDSKRAERTPSLAAVIQEVVNRSGWANGNSIALIVTGTGQRVAKSFDTASGASAPVLHVEWQISSQTNAAPTVSIDPVADVTLPAGTSLSGHVSDDGLPYPPGATTVSWAKQSGPGSVTFANPTAAATTASFSTAGSYVLRLTASDSALSAFADLTVSVNPVGSVVLAAAGDICATGPDCAPTATLLDTIAPSRVIALGDNAYEDGSLAQYTSVYDPNWGRPKAKTSPTPGNHEYHTPGASGYFTYFGGRAPATYYSYDLGSWHLISLNGEVSATAGSEQETWLKNDLAAHAGQCTLAYWHEPRFSSGTTHVSNASFDPFWRDLYAAGADIVLNGHEHNYERFAPQNPSGVADSAGIREFVVGTGGASEGEFPFGTPIANSEVRNTGTSGVLQLTLNATGYDWKFVPAAGATFTDSGSDLCVRPGTPTNTAPTVSIDPVADVTLPAGTSVSGHVSDDGLPNPPGATTLAWTKQSGPGTVSFTAATPATTTVSFSAAGSYVLRLTANDGALSGFAEVSVTVNAAAPTNTAPSVSIDPVADVTLPAGTSVSGHVSDDGLPNPPGATTLSWTKQSGPGTVSFTDATAATTTVSFSAAGSYVLRLTANDGALSSFAEVSVTVNPAPVTNTAPSVSIDPVADVTLPAGASLSGHVSDDGLPNPPGATTLAWTKQSGPGTVSFTDATAATTTVSFSTAGSYVLRLTANDGALSGFAEVSVTVNAAAPTNTAPTVSIDPVADVTLPAGTSVSGHVSDDGLPNPPGATTLAWTKQSGPGTVSFTDATAATTTVSFSAAGSYVLRLTANDGALSGFAEVSVTVNPAAATNTAPTVSIDPVADVTLPAGTNLTGHVSDDGLPNPPGATTIA